MIGKNHTGKRQHFFVKKEFQVRFILKFSLLILAGGAVSTALLLYFSHGTLTSTFQDSRLVLKDTALSIFPLAVYATLVSNLLVMAAAVFVMLFVSHRLAGPMFRFEKEIRAIAAGDLTVKIQLREKDQLGELAVQINEMTGELNRKLRATQEELSIMAELAAQPEENCLRLKEGMAALKRKFDADFTL